MIKKIELFILRFLFVVFALGAFFSFSKIVSASTIFTAAGPGGGPHIRSFSTEGQPASLDFFAFDQNFRGGLNIAAADIDNDGHQDLISSPASQGGPQVQIFDDLGNLRSQFFAYSESFRGGVDVAIGNLDASEQKEIVTGPGPGGGPQVRIFDQNGNPKITPGFFAFSENFRGGIRLTCGDIDQDGEDEIIVGAGPGGGPHIRIFEADGTVRPIQFFAFHPNYRGGLDVAAADVDQDGKDEISVCQTTDQAWCKVYRYNEQQTIIGEWKAYGDFEVGAYVEMADIDNDGQAEVITGPGSGGGPQVRIFKADGTPVINGFFAYSPAFRGGVRVAEFPEDQTLNIQSWHYQLQNTDFNNLMDLKVDLLVIDIDDANFTQSELSNLKTSGKTVLSYLSIGEAEEYRDYWRDDWQVGSPGFLDQENPNWAGNYKVKYWQQEWQDIILSSVSEIAAQGYDGVYLDIIDAYEYYQQKGRTSAKAEMMQFVQEISETGKAINQDFLVVPQNAPELYEDTEYQSVIDGFGKEDTWYNDNDRQDNQETISVLDYLDQAAADGKLILSIDYPTESAKICDFYTKCEEHGFACTVSNRDLDKEEPLICH